MARTTAVPKRSGSATTSSTGTPSIVSPTARRSLRSTSATIWGSSAKRASTGRRIRLRAHHGQALARVAPAPHVAGRLAPQGVGDPADELPRAVEREPALRPRLGLARERREDLRLDLRPDPRHGAQPSGGRGLAELLGRGTPSARAISTERLDVSPR